MKLILKGLAIVILVAIMFFSITSLDGATKVTIEGTGTASAECDNNGNVTWTCEPTSSNPCTITVIFNQ